MVNISIKKRLWPLSGFAMASYFLSSEDGYSSGLSGFCPIPWAQKKKEYWAFKDGKLSGSAKYISVSWT